MTWWISFAGDTYLGAVLVDGAEDFRSAYFMVTLAGINPGGEVKGVPVELEDVPEEYREAWAGLPRMTLLSVEDLRVLGPLMNLRGEDR